MDAITSRRYVIFPCQGNGCTELVIADKKFKTKRCHKCNHKHDVSNLVEIKAFDTWEEASDALRLLKIPAGEREKAIDGDLPYRSSIWDDSFTGEIEFSVFKLKEGDS